MIIKACVHYLNKAFIYIQLSLYTVYSQHSAPPPSLRPLNQTNPTLTLLSVWDSSAMTAPTQMPSSAQATSDSGLSSSQQSALDKLLQVMSQDSEALSVCSEKKPKGKNSKAKSLPKRVRKQLSRAKKNMDKLIKWLREVENVWTSETTAGTLGNQSN